MAREMPALPLLASTTVWPGCRAPLRSAASIMARAMRSLTEPPGFADSSLACRPPPGASRRSDTTGVLPMVSVMLGWMNIVFLSGTGAAPASARAPGTRRSRAAHCPAAPAPANPSSAARRSCRRSRARRGRSGRKWRSTAGHKPGSGRGASGFSGSEQRQGVGQVVPVQLGGAGAVGGNRQEAGLAVQAFGVGDARAGFQAQLAVAEAAGFADGAFEQLAGDAAAAVALAHVEATQFGAAGVLRQGAQGELADGFALAAGQQQAAAGRLVFGIDQTGLQRPGGLGQEGLG